MIRFGLPDPKKLRIPESVLSLADNKKGLVLITGSAGTGKSTTLACMIDRINKSRDSHIITMEDPIEYIHRHEKSIVTQREISIDTPGYPGNSERSFAEPKKMEWRQAEREKIMSDDKLLQKHGDIGTFIVRVQHRQNSSWQGRITWMENDQTIQFRSIWEMIKLIESAVDTVSAPDDETEPTWTVAKTE